MHTVNSPPAPPLLWFPTVEADGPVHFAANSHHLLGGTALKRRLLQVGGGLLRREPLDLCWVGRARWCRLRASVRACVTLPSHSIWQSVQHELPLLPIPMCCSAWAGARSACPTSSGGRWRRSSGRHTCGTSWRQQGCVWMRRPRVWQVASRSSSRRMRSSRMAAIGCRLRRHRSKPRCRLQAAEASRRRVAVATASWPLLQWQSVPSGFACCSTDRGSCRAAAWWRAPAACWLRKKQQRRRQHRATSMAVAATTLAMSVQGMASSLKHYSPVIQVLPYINVNISSRWRMNDRAVARRPMHDAVQTQYIGNISAC